MPRSKADRSAAAKAGWEKRRARRAEREAARARRAEAARRGWETRRGLRRLGELWSETDALPAGADEFDFRITDEEEEQERFGAADEVIVEDPVVKTPGKKKQRRRETRPGKGHGWR